MVTTVAAFVTVLLLGAALAQSPEPPTHPLPPVGNLTEFIQIIIADFEDDDFANITTRGTEDLNTPRKKRSLGFGGHGFGGYGNGAYGNNNAFFGSAGNGGYGHGGYGNGAFGNNNAFFGNGGSYGGGCGSYPAQGISFARCFTPGRVVVQNNHIVRNYYKEGNYGQCLNYFRALPCNNVATVTHGYVGHITATSGRSYTVNACQSCCGGNPGIIVRCNSRPYSRLVRQFVFKPQINNVNYNNYNQYNVQDGGYGGYVDYGYGGIGGYGYGGFGGDYGYGGGHGYGDAGCPTC
ncbi:hypothetical protein SNE40_005560 [Patella caerulea]|uniref:Uncharacterized protein n=1 Tax=Patella caerulea TaxID=87958 RepID=A0AAN8JX90_PATCE